MITSATFYSLDTPAGSILVAPCLHPDSNAERPDVPLSLSCDAHNRTVYVCLDFGGLSWCDGGAPEYRWHWLRLEPDLVDPA